MDGVSFIDKYNPLDQARAPSGRIWRKPSEGLCDGCTAKGAHLGTGGRVVKFMVTVSYGNGVIMCEQYEKLNGCYFKSLVKREFPRMFNTAAKGGPKLFIQDEDPSKNSSIACAAWQKLGTKLISIPARSPDINFIENIFNTIKGILKNGALKHNIMFESYSQFCQRVVKTITTFNPDIIDKTVESTLYEHPNEVNN